MGALAVLFLWPRPVPADDRMELHIVLAIDVSASVNDREFALQRRGTAAAFRDAAIKEAVADAPGGIAVSIIQWSSLTQQAVGLDWVHLHDAAGVETYAERVAAMPRRLPGGGTMIHSGLVFAERMFARAPGEPRRRVIDLSGNGRADDPKKMQRVRQRVIASGITINALAIEEHPGKLTPYFRDYLIGGPGAFAMTADSFEVFGTAMRAKLLREIEGPSVAQGIRRQGLTAALELQPSPIEGEGG